MTQPQKHTTTSEDPEPRWWQRTRTILAITTALMVVGLIALIIAGYWLAWPWVGVSDYTDPKGDYHPPKTLWDWLSLLFIPIVIGAGTYWFRRTEQQIEQHRTEQRAELERQAAEKRAETERALALDTQEEAALQTYLGRMTELLLANKLRASEEDSEVRAIARTLTLTVLHRLNSDRKGAVVQFLHEAELIHGAISIIKLHNANLEGANLQGANLQGANLQGAKLQAANLQGANFEWASLEHANLQKADLRGANLQKANLHGANLQGASLGGANLQAANFERASLEHANLQGANFEWASLEHANLQKADLRGANFEWANLQGASLEHANLHGANLHGASLGGASLGGARLN